MGMQAGGTPRPGNRAGAISPAAARVSLRMAVNQALTNGAYTDIGWTQNLIAPVNITHDLVTNNEDITIDVAGRYLVNLRCQFLLVGAASAATPLFNAQMLLNGVAIRIAAHEPLLSGGILYAATANIGVTLTGIVDLAVGNVLSFQAQCEQASGTPQLVALSIGTPRTWLDIHQLS